MYNNNCYKTNSLIQDKTFGLKNKKGAKQQKFIQQVEKQVKSGGVHPVKPVEDKKKEKEQKLKEQKELAALFKPVQTQKVEKGMLCCCYIHGTNRGLDHKIDGVLAQLFCSVNMPS